MIMSAGDLGKSIRRWQYIVVEEREQVDVGDDCKAMRGRRFRKS